MLNYTECYCKNCIRSHFNCSYMPVYNELVRRLEDLENEYGKPYVKDEKKPFTKGIQINSPFIMGIQCDYYDAIPEEAVK